MRKEKSYVNPYLGGTLLGLVLFSAYFFTGGGLGASGGLNHIQVWFLDLFASSHVDRVAYLADMGGGSKNAFLNATVYMVIGVLVGGMLSGFLNGRFKVETRKGAGVSNRTRWLMAFAGGLIMAYGARLARGCTSGQALSGGAVLSVGSWVFMFSVFAGAYGLAYFLRKFWRAS